LFRVFTHLGQQTAVVVVDIPVFLSLLGLVAQVQEQALHRTGAVIRLHTHTKPAHSQ